MEILKETDDFKFICPQEMIDEKPGREYRNIEHITYPSQTIGIERGANIVFPLNYSEDKEYPVLYVFHGIFCHEGTMLYDEDSRIPEILGNMADAGKAREVITVFCNVYATADPNAAPGFSAEALEPYITFIDDLVNDLMPYIEAHYPVLGGTANVGLLGFSMGGRVAMHAGIKRPDLFKNIAAAAPGPGLIYGKDWAMEHPGIYSKENLRPQIEGENIDIFLICKGNKDSVVGKFPNEYHDVLEQNGVEHIWYEAPELEHGEPIVQSALYNFMLLWK